MPGRSRRSCQHTNIIAPLSTSRICHMLTMSARWWCSFPFATRLGVCRRATLQVGRSSSELYSLTLHVHTDALLRRISRPAWLILCCASMGLVQVLFLFANVHLMVGWFSGRGGGGDLRERQRSLILFYFFVFFLSLSFFLFEANMPCSRSFFFFFFFFFFAFFCPSVCRRRLLLLLFYSPAHCWLTVLWGNPARIFVSTTNNAIMGSCLPFEPSSFLLYHRHHDHLLLFRWIFLPHSYGSFFCIIPTLCSQVRNSCTSV